MNRVNSPDLALWCLRDVARQLDHVLAVAVAGRNLIERKGDDGDLTAAHLFDAIADIAQEAGSANELRGYLERLKAADTAKAA